MDDEVRDRLVSVVMHRDRLAVGAARAIVNGMSVADLTRLELEARDHLKPAFTSQYDPFERR